MQILLHLQNILTELEEELKDLNQENYKENKQQLTSQRLNNEISGEYKELFCKINLKLIEYNIYPKCTANLHVSYFCRWCYLPTSKTEYNQAAYWEKSDKHFQYHYKDWYTDLWQVWLNQARIWFCCCNTWCWVQMAKWVNKKNLEKNIKNYNLSKMFAFFVLFWKKSFYLFFYTSVVWFLSSICQCFLTWLWLQRSVELTSDFNSIFSTLVSSPSFLVVKRV